jgi:hypothetical protein
MNIVPPELPEPPEELSLDEPPQAARQSGSARLRARRESVVRMVVRIQEVRSGTEPGAP